ncbi:metallophosphoesterase [Candidatus Woesearchaeota archaeon]|nr:metallophosphoesterase [Candidatus Woesearchaeota archaeon]
MRLGILSDVHGDHESLDAAVNHCNADVLLICGDLAEQMYDPEVFKAFDAEFRKAAQDYANRKLVVSRGSNEGFRKAAQSIYEALRGEFDLPLPQELIDARDALLENMRAFCRENYARDKQVLDGHLYFIVPGNHDHEAIMKEVFDDVWLHRRHANLNGRSFYGYGGSEGPDNDLDIPPTAEPLVLLGETLFNYSEEIQEDAPPSDVYVSHIPPLGILDLSKRRVHLGSRALREHLGTHKIVACGHVHEAAGSAYLDGTLIVNSGRLGLCKLNPITGSLQKDPARKGYFAVVEDNLVEHYMISREGISLYERKKF